MLIQAWNIRAAQPARLDEVLKVIAGHSADTLVLGETTPRNVGPLTTALRACGFGNVHAVSPIKDDRGVLIASKSRFDIVSASAVGSVPSHRWAEVWFPKRKFRMAGLYFPSTSEKITEFWPRVHEAAQARRDDQYLLLGDLNSGQSIFDTEGGKLTGDPWFTAMPHFGMFDLWRHRNKDAREYSWQSYNRDGTRSGCRLDHAFGTISFRSRVREIRYSHGERTRGISDHSSLLVRVH